MTITELMHSHYNILHFVDDHYVSSSAMPMYAAIVHILGLSTHKLDIVSAPLKQKIFFDNKRSKKSNLCLEKISSRVIP